MQSRAGPPHRPLRAPAPAGPTPCRSSSLHAPPGTASRATAFGTNPRLQCWFCQNSARFPGLPAFLPRVHPARRPHALPLLRRPLPSSEAASFQALFHQYFTLASSGGASAPPQRRRTAPARTPRRSSSRPRASRTQRSSFRPARSWMRPFCAFPAALSRRPRPSRSWWSRPSGTARSPPSSGTAHPPTACGRSLFHPARSWQYTRPQACAARGTANPPGPRAPARDGSRRRFWPRAPPCCTAGQAARHTFS